MKFERDRRSGHHGQRSPRDCKRARRLDSFGHERGRKGGGVRRRYQVADAQSSSKEFRRFSAVPVIADTILLLNHALRKANCDISFEHTPGLIEVYGSPGRLAQVVTNLVTNAIDASRPAGGGPIRLTLSAGENEVQFTVSDEGTGIPADVVKRIFDPMFTTKPFGEGTGLGLSIVHNIVSSDFNGTIEVDTEVGRGTQFILCFREPEGERA